MLSGKTGSPCVSLRAGMQPRSWKDYMQIWKGGGGGGDQRVTSSGFFQTQIRCNSEVLVKAMGGTQHRVCTVRFPLRRFTRWFGCLKVFRVLLPVFILAGPLRKLALRKSFIRVWKLLLRVVRFWLSVPGFFHISGHSFNSQSNVLV